MLHMTNRETLKKMAIGLRKQGKTYSEIQNILREKIPKSTLSGWCKNIQLSSIQKERIKRIIRQNAKNGREVALRVNRKHRQEYLASIPKRNKHLDGILEDTDTAKIALAMLYLGEGSKGSKNSRLLFANSDPFVIDLYLRVLKQCYDLDKSKFRCTILCRADQNVKKLENFWHKTTKISSKQFYKTRIDARTIGKPSKKPRYKGVCCIDYLSADLFLEVMSIPRIIHRGP